MLDEHPSAAELVAAVAGFLESEVAPALDGRIVFHTRVAVNALRIVERELTSGSAAVAADTARLRDLTGAAGSLASLNSALAAQIRDGTLSTSDGALREHLIRSVLARIAIDNPRYPSLRDVPDHWSPEP
jgi:hypothetical protein